MSEKLQSKERKFWTYLALGIVALLGLDALLD